MTASSDHVLRVKCPNLSCQRVLAVPADARGKLVRCSACGITVRIPLPKGSQAPANPSQAQPDGS